MTFLCKIALRNKTAAHSFLQSFDKANDCLCPEELYVISFETENKAAFWVSNVRLSMVAHILEYFDARKTRERDIF